MSSAASQPADDQVVDVLRLLGPEEGDDANRAVAQLRVAQDGLDLGWR